MYQKSADEMRHLTRSSWPTAHHAVLWAITKRSMRKARWAPSTKDGITVGRRRFEWGPDHLPVVSNN